MIDPARHDHNDPKIYEFTTCRLCISVRKELKIHNYRCSSCSSLKAKKILDRHDVVMKRIKRTTTWEVLTLTLAAIALAIVLYFFR